MTARIAPLAILLAMGCKPQSAELNTTNYFAFMSESTSFSLLKGTVDPEDWSDKFVVDCRDFGTKKENEVLKLPDALKICKDWTDRDGDGHPAPEIESWMGQGGFHVLTEEVVPWRGEAIITSEHDLQLSFHHRLPGGGDFRFSIVVDPDFQPTECAVKGEGADAQPIDGDWLENWTQDLRNLADADELKPGHQILADHIDKGKLWYLNARGFQLDPADPEDTFWSLPEHYRAGFAAAKFAEEKFHTRAPRWGDPFVYDLVENDMNVTPTSSDLWYTDPNGFPGADGLLEDLVPDPIDADGDGYSEDADCDDNNAQINPSIDETCDGVDQDCDERIDNGLECADDDGDGYCEAGCTDGSMEGDCNDTLTTTYPGAEELIDGTDNDCDGIVGEAVDDDGDGVSEEGGDCDDNDASVSPRVVEVCNEIDDDCDGEIDNDTECSDDDNDGYCEVEPCRDGALEGDCDDANGNVNLGEVEIDGNDVDDDCDGTVDDGSDDFDNDGWAFDDGNIDCDDGNDTVYPGAPELADGVDNDCDTFIDNHMSSYDDDGDGYSEDDGDCDDNDPDVNPDENETGNGVDDNCDGVVDVGTDFYDDDGDGFTEDGGDCDDDDPDVRPGAIEEANSIDDDCDDDIDEGTDVYDDDGDGFTENDGDLDDSNNDVYPDAPDCRNQIDDDDDGVIDENGYDCVHIPLIESVQEVADTIELEFADVEVDYAPLVHDNYWRAPDGYTSGLDSWVGLHYNYVAITGEIAEGEEISGAFNLVLDGDDSNSRIFLSGKFEVPKIKKDRWTTEDLRAIKLEENDTTLCVEND